MFAVTVVQAGLFLAAAGLICFIKPLRFLRMPTRRRAAVAIASGLGIAVIGCLLPTYESRANPARTKLDEFAPIWQFNEVHSLNIAAPPDRVFQAITQVRANEIFLFKTLTWIRRGGRNLPESIVNAGDRDPIIDVATRTTFFKLADEPPRELVLGTVVLAPRPVRAVYTADIFKQALPPGFALASMNFLVEPDGEGGSTVSTETRVFASSPAARRRFAAYWRVIYPGSAVIRLMWLRAIRNRVAEAGAPSATMQRARAE